MKEKIFIQKNKNNILMKNCWECKEIEKKIILKK